MWRVETEVGDQRLREALDGELRRAVGGVGDVRAERRPEAVDAARVDDVAFLAGEQQRQERARAEVDAAPADAEGAIPLRPFIGDEAAATADAGVVEQQVDVL